MENDKMRMNHIAEMKQIEKEISCTKGVRPADFSGSYTISKIELLHATINNIFVPIVVSVITTLITIWITSHV